MSIKKIVALGPENTGKSTLSQALAEKLHTLWVPEYAREYLEQTNNVYKEEDLHIIAQGQLQSEDALAEKAHNYLICDTDLYVIKVWSEHKYSRVHADILQQIAQRKYDLYLLTYPDIPWEYDPLREYPDIAERAHFYQIYKDIVINSGVPWADIRGVHEDRLKDSLTAIKKYL